MAGHQDEHGHHPSYLKVYFILSVLVHHLGSWSRDGVSSFHRRSGACEEAFGSFNCVWYHR